MRISDWSSDVCSSDLRFALAEVVTDRRDHCRQLHAEKKLAEEALLCGLEAGARRGLCAAVERRVLEAVDNGGEFERPFHVAVDDRPGVGIRSEEHTSELQSLMRISYAVFCLKKKQKNKYHTTKK